MHQFREGEDERRNLEGRPSVEQQKDEPERHQQIKASELRSSVNTLRRAVPRALRLLIENMDNEEIPLKDRMKNGKEIFDLYLKAVSGDMALKKAKHAMKNNPQGSDKEDDEDKPQVPAVVFQLHKTGTK